MKRQNSKLSTGTTVGLLIRGLSSLLLAAAVFAGASVAQAQTPGPVIYFTDLKSGPNAGGESVSGFAGAYVTIYGNFFGPSQGSSSVTWNGLNCLRVVPSTGGYAGWGSTWNWYQKIIVQLGPACTPGTGDFVVTVNGVASTASHVVLGGVNVDNGSFTVNSTGHIRCVSTGGNNANSGSFPSSCWGDIEYAGHNTLPGDITYVENGVTQTACNNVSANLSVTNSGTSWANSMALVAYPGATATIGPGCERAVDWCAGYSVCTPVPAWWTLAGFVVNSGGNTGMFTGAPHTRFIGNDVTCPNGNAANGCIGTGQIGDIVIYGNNEHDVAISSASAVTKLFHSMYIGDGGNIIDVGWNTISNNHADRAIQVFTSTPNGAGDIFDIHIHDNLIHDSRGVGILLNGVATDKGPAEVYNNVVYNAGIGPDFADGSVTRDCFYLATLSSTVQIQVYNNTAFSCGGAGSGNVVSLWGITNFTNNIFYNTAPLGYFFVNASTNTTCSNNLFFGAGAPPSFCTTNAVTVDPGFANLTLHDFHLTTASPAKDAGVMVSSLLWDHDGISRPQGSAYDIGAYEYFAGGSTVQRPNPPTNLTVVVN